MERRYGDVVFMAGRLNRFITFRLTKNTNDRFRAVMFLLIEATP